MSTLVPGVTMNCKATYYIYTPYQLHSDWHHSIDVYISYKGNQLRQMSTLVPGVTMNCKLHTIFIHLSTTQWLNHWLMLIYFYKGNWLGQMSTLVPGVIMNCKLHTIFIGASLSEPHTSVTAFAEVVCMYVCLQPYSVNFKWANSFVHVICPTHCRRRWKATAGVQRQRESRETKTTQDNARMATADHDRQGQAAHTQYKSRTVVEFAQVSPCIIDTHKRENFSLVKACV